MNLMSIYFRASQESNVVDSDIWIIDSGFTSHMLKYLSIFSSIDNNIQSKVKLSNGEVVKQKEVELLQSRPKRV